MCVWIRRGARLETEPGGVEGEGGNGGYVGAEKKKKGWKKWVGRFGFEL